MNKRIFSIIVLSGLLGMGCAQHNATSPPAKAAPAKAAAPAVSAEQAAYDKAYSDVKKAKKKASSVGGEWRDIGKMMKGAKKSAAKGNYAKAMKLLKSAKTQAVLGYDQAIAEQGVGVPAYVK